MEFKTIVLLVEVVFVSFHEGRISRTGAHKKDKGVVFEGAAYADRTVGAIVHNSVKSFGEILRIALARSTSTFVDGATAGSEVK